MEAYQKDSCNFHENCCVDGLSLEGISLSVECIKRLSISPDFNSDHFAPFLRSVIGLFKEKFMNTGSNKKVRGEVEKILGWCRDTGGVEEELLGWSDLNNSVKISTLHKLSGMTRVKVRA